MPIDFPNSPAPDQVFTVGDRAWKWNDTADVWESVAIPGPTGPAGPTGPQGIFTATGPTAPTGATAPATGSVWYNTETGQMLVRYDDYWVESHGALVGESGTQFIQASTTGPTVGDGDNGDLWIVYS